MTHTIDESVMTDVFATIEHAINERAERALGDDTPDNVFMVAAARSSLMSMRMMFAAIAGKPQPLLPPVQALARAISDVIAVADDKSNGSVTDVEDAEQLQQLVFEKEEVDMLLTQARIISLGLLANLNEAYRRIK